jgi:hypothetical protein
MTDAKKIEQLQDALKVAMMHWAGWTLESRGVRPWEIMEESADWQHCEVLANAWTPHALGGIGS